MRIVWLLLICLSLCAGATIKHKSSAQVIKTENIITTIRFLQNRLYVCNAQGGVEIFTLDSNKKAKKIKQITLPNIRDFLGESIAPKVFDIATSDGNTLYILAQASDAKAQIIALDSTSGAQKVIFTSDLTPKRIIAKNKFELIVGFLSNEIGIFDTNKLDFTRRIQISSAGFSDLALSGNFIFSSDESGAISVIDSALQGKIASLDMINKDNNYQVAASSGVVLSAGQDRKMAIYRFADTNAKFNLKSAKFIESEFLIYAVGISPSGEFGAFVKNENNDISVVNLSSLTEIFMLSGATAALNSLVFINDDLLVSASDDKEFIVWNLK